MQRRGAPALALALGVESARFFQRLGDSTVMTEFIFGPFFVIRLDAAVEIQAHQFFPTTALQRRWPR